MPLELDSPHLTRQQPIHTTHALTAPATDTESMAVAYARIRRQTVRLCEPLSAEDHVVQTAPQVGPAKWHLAHTTWHFESRLLGSRLPNYRPFNPQYRYLFSDAADADGDPAVRDRRGLYSRPTVDEVHRYRRYVDRCVCELLEAAVSRADSAAIADLLANGLRHEQRHQELILADIKHVFWCNPLRPAYRERDLARGRDPGAMRWCSFAAGRFEHNTPTGAAHAPAHKFAWRPVTNGEYAAFIEDGGYRRPELWQPHGWRAARECGWIAPLYWERFGDHWWIMTLGGMKSLDRASPVCHVSFWEADAYARWAGARLPSEPEWNRAANDAMTDGNLLESGHLHPRATPLSAPSDTPAQLFGDVWEWTDNARDADAPFVNFANDGAGAASSGAEWRAVRGGSCLTPESSIRRNMRRVLPPETRWQVTGIRLAADC